MSLTVDQLQLAQKVTIVLDAMYQAQFGNSQPALDAVQSLFDNVTNARYYPRQGNQHAKILCMMGGQLGVFHYGISPGDIVEVITTAATPRNTRYFSALPLAWSNSLTLRRDINSSPIYSRATSLFLSGHSDGAAAVQCMLAEMRAYEDMRPATMVTIGSPKAGDQRLQNLIANPNWIDLANDNDIIGVIPPNANLIQTPALQVILGGSNLLTLLAQRIFDIYRFPLNKQILNTSGYLSSQYSPNDETRLYTALADVVASIVGGQNAPQGAVEGHWASEYLRRIESALNRASGSNSPTREQSNSIRQGFFMPTNNVPLNLPVPPQLKLSGTEGNPNKPIESPDYYGPEIPWFVSPPAVRDFGILSGAVGDIEYQPYPQQQNFLEEYTPAFVSNRNAAQVAGAAQSDAMTAQQTNAQIANAINGGILGMAGAISANSTLYQIGQTTMILIPKQYKPQVFPAPPGQHAVYWMNTPVAYYPSKAQARTFVKLILRLANNLTKANSFDISDLNTQFTSFIQAGSGATGSSNGFVPSLPGV